jgi:hypothetical protein
MAVLKNAKLKASCSSFMKCVVAGMKLQIEGEAGVEGCGPGKEARAPYINVIVIRANPAKTTIALSPLEPTRSAKDCTSKIITAWRSGWGQQQAQRCCNAVQLKPAPRRRTFQRSIRTAA